MNRLTNVLTLLLLVVVSCSCEDEYDRDYDRADRTPGGLHVQFDDLGTLSTGLSTKAEVYRVFDAVFLEAGKAFEVKHGIALQNYLSAPHDHKIVFRLIDGWHFYSPTNGWIEGEAYGRETILLSWWNKRLYPLAAQIQNPWTISPDLSGVLYYGDRPGQIRDLIAHEMGHVFFGPAFGH